MITVLHPLVDADEPERARAFFRDVLERPYVDTGGGWLVFESGPSELGEVKKLDFGRTIQLKLPGRARGDALPVSLRPSGAHSLIEGLTPSSAESP